MRNEVFESIDLFLVTCIRNTYTNMMLKNMYEKHVGTFIHSLHTAMIASSMGTAYNQLFAKKDEQLLDLEALVDGAILHDIGKLIIRNDVLNNELDGIPLTEEEQIILLTHPADGYNNVKNHLNNPIILDIVKHHHERIDGSGYPDRLKGEQISLYAQIVGVADTFDIALGQAKMTEKNMKLDAVLKALEVTNNSKFDGQIVGLLKNRISIMTEFWK